MVLGDEDEAPIGSTDVCDDSLARNGGYDRETRPYIGRAFDEAVMQGLRVRPRRRFGPFLLEAELGDLLGDVEGVGADGLVAGLDPGEVHDTAVHDGRHYSGLLRRR